MNNNPFVTYIAPIRNESLFIERMIKSIINQNYNNFDYEIILLMECQPMVQEI